MSKTPTPQIVSANDLMDGDVVYLTNFGDWSRQIEEAAIAPTSDTADALLAAADQPDKVIGSYLVPIDQSEDGPVPRHFRERFRLAGPSVRADFRDNTRPEQSNPQQTQAGGR